MQTGVRCTRLTFAFVAFGLGLGLGCDSNKTSKAVPAPNDAAAAPNDDVDSVLAPYAGLCPRRQQALQQALCPAGQTTTCDPGCTHYLAANGNDSADGKAGILTGASGPWQSIDRLNRATLQTDDVVCFRRGDVFRGEIQTPYGLHSDPYAPLTFESYGDQTQPQPVISGAKLLPKTWAVATGSIYQIDLSNTLWAGTPYTRNGQSYTPHDRVHQLFADGKMQTLARFPNLGAGDSTVLGVDTAAGNYSMIDAVLGGNGYQDTALPTTSPLRAKVDFTGAALFYRSNRWIIESSAITAQSGQTITTQDALECASQNCLGWGYFLVDHPAALDLPGEWYYDAATKNLFYWPPADVSLDTALFEAAIYREDVEPPSWDAASTPPELDLTVGLSLQGNSGVSVRDLSFRYYSKAGIWAVSDLNPSSSDKPVSTTNLTIEGCEFLYTGASGIDLSRWSSPDDVPANNRIASNTFSHELSQAIALRTTGTEVSCNNVSDIGRLEDYSRFGMTMGDYTVHDQGKSIMTEQNGVSLLFNRFARTSSAAISWSGPNNLIAFNVIQEACYTKSDCGGLYSYTWGDQGFDGVGISGSTVARNLVLNTKGAVEGAAADTLTPLGNGMFIDLGGHDFLIKQNLVAGSTTTGLMSQRNHAVTIEENLFYDNTHYNDTAYLLGDLSIITDVSPSAATVSNNQIVSPTATSIPLGIRGDTPEQSGTYDNNQYFFPYAWDNTLKDNRWDGYTVFVAPAQGDVTKYSLQKWQAAREPNAQGAPVSWPSWQVVAQNGPNLIGNSSFDNGISGWTTETWSPSKVSADNHPDLGPCLKYERNGAEGGRIGALSNTYHLETGHTYWVHFWIASDPTAAEPLAPQATVDPNQSWNFVPGDKIREVTYLYSPTTSTDQGQFELTSYPLYGDRYWIDDVIVKDVTAVPYRNAAIIRFDETLPSNARSILIYNDTETAQTVNLGGASFVAPDGTASGTSVTVYPYRGTVLIPAAWSQNPVKVK
jgi:hypothetical protein